MDEGIGVDHFEGASGDESRFQRFTGKGSNCHEESRAQPFAAAVDGRIGCAPGLALHLWHGDPANRGYGSRTAIMRRGEFDPAVDLRLNAEGVWEWASDKPALHREVRSYFDGRREDG